MTAELKRYDLFATGPDYDAFFSDIVETPEGKYVRFADVEAYTQSAIAAAMRGAAEHLYQLMMDNSDEALQAQIDCLLADMTLDGSPNLAAYFRDKLIASIPTDAATTLGAALLGAYKEGWSDGAANCHHDRNETPDDGWLISDTYKSIPADAAAALEAVKAQVRDDTVRSAAIAAGNAIVAIAADADPDISPLRKQMLRVKMEKAVKAAFTRDA